MMATSAWRRACAHHAGATAAVALIAGCDPASTDPAYWERAPAESVASGSTAETAGAGPGAGGGAVTSSSSTVASSSSGAPLATCASIAFTTVSYDGRYEPDNVGAVWISDTSGVFVRTLERWGSRRLKNVVAWREASGGNEVDAITGATKHSHGPHELVWDCRDAGGAVRDAGTFELHAEFTEEDSAEGHPPGPHRVFPFDLAVPGPLLTPDDAAFHDVRIVVRP